MNKNIHNIIFVSNFKFTFLYKWVILCFNFVWDNIDSVFSFCRIKEYNVTITFFVIHNSRFFWSSRFFGIIRCLVSFTQTTFLFLFNHIYSPLRLRFLRTAFDVCSLIPFLASEPPFATEKYPEQ